MSRDDFDERTLRFTTWFTAEERRRSGTFLGADQVDGQSSAIQDGSSRAARIAIVDKRHEGKGRAVIATEDIEADAILFTVSHPDILSILTSGVRKHIDKAQISVLPAWAACVIALIYEHGLGADGKWWPYLSMLPSTFDTLMHWNDGELEELQGSHVMRRIGREDAEDAIRTQIWPIVREHALCFGHYAEALSSSDETQALSSLSELAHVFATLVMAYAFDLDDDGGEVETDKSMDEDGFIEDAPYKGMIPFADMLNSQPGELSNARLFHNEDSVSMVAIKPIKIGDEIFSDCGSLPNAEMLRCYGFITDNCDQYDVAELELEQLIGLSKKLHGLTENQIEKRLNLAEKWDVIDDSFDLLRGHDGDQPFDDGLLLTVMLLTSDDRKLKTYKQVKRPPPAAKSIEVAQLIMKAIQERQKRYSTSLANDKMMLTGEKGGRLLSKRQFMALRVRLGEKEVLASNFDFLATWLNAAVGGDNIKDRTRRDAKRRRT